MDVMKLYKNSQKSEGDKMKNWTTVTKCKNYKNCKGDAENGSDLCQYCQMAEKDSPSSDEQIRREASRLSKPPRNFRDVLRDL